MTFISEYNKNYYSHEQLTHTIKIVEKNSYSLTITIELFLLPEETLQIQNSLMVDVGSLKKQTITTIAKQWNLLAEGILKDTSKTLSHWQDYIFSFDSFEELKTITAKITENKLTGEAVLKNIILLKNMSYLDTSTLYLLQDTYWLKEINFSDSSTYEILSIFNSDKLKIFKTYCESIMFLMGETKTFSVYESAFIGEYFSRETWDFLQNKNSRVLVARFIRNFSRPGLLSHLQNYSSTELLEASFIEWGGIDTKSMLALLPLVPANIVYESKNTTPEGILENVLNTYSIPYSEEKQKLADNLSLYFRGLNGRAQKGRTELESLLLKILLNELTVAEVINIYSTFIQNKISLNIFATFVLNHKEILEEMPLDWWLILNKDDK